MISNANSTATVTNTRTTPIIWIIWVKPLVAAANELGIVVPAAQIQVGVDGEAYYEGETLGLRPLD